MQKFRNTLCMLFLAVFVTVVIGVPTWSAPCCDGELMECCAEPASDDGAPTCCDPVVIVNALQVDVALATLPTLPAPCSASVPGILWIDVVFKPKSASALSVRIADRSGPLIPPPLALIETFLI